MPDSSSSGQAVQARILAERFRQAVESTFASDTELLRRGVLVDTRCLIEIDTEQLLLTIRNGRPTIAQRVALLGSWEFAIRAGAEAWMALWQPAPKPGWHDLFALTKRGAMRIEGSLQPFMANLQYFKDLVTLPREGGPR
ncbi:MAG: hypothetical protein ACTS6J_00960 [Burkholderiales bacterium]